MRSGSSQPAHCGRGFLTSITCSTSSLDQSSSAGDLLLQRAGRRQLALGDRQHVEAVRASTIMYSSSMP